MMAAPKPGVCLVAVVMLSRSGLAALQPSERDHARTIGGWKCEWPDIPPLLRNTIHPHDHGTIRTVATHAAPVARRRLGPPAASRARLDRRCPPGGAGIGQAAEDPRHGETTGEHRMIGVMSASGQLGGGVVQHLRLNGVAPSQIAALTRNPANLDQFSDQGLQVRAGGRSERRHRPRDPLPDGQRAGVPDALPGGRRVPADQPDPPLPLPRRGRGRVCPDHGPHRAPHGQAGPRRPCLSVRQAFQHPQPSREH